ILHCLERGHRLDQFMRIELSHQYPWHHYLHHLSDVTDAVVKNMYLSSEVPFIALPCLHGHLHLCNDDLHEEVLLHGEDVNDQVGALVLSTLDTKIRPLMRYSNGDLIKRYERPCTCGDTSPVITF